MVVLCVGVLMGGLSQVSSAAPPNDIAVTASIIGPAPTTPATIDSPADGSRFTAKPITVSGSCPANTYVELIRNGIASGIAICQADLTYTILTDLFVGANALQSQVYNTTDVLGPISSTVTVYYDPPVPSQPPVQPGTPTTGQPTTGQPQPTSGGTTAPPRTSQPNQTLSVPPLVLQTEFNYTGHFVGNPAEFKFTISGGRAPYAISIDWGDGTTKLLTVEQAGEFKVEHVYKNPGGFSGSYKITVSAADAAGNETILQTLTLIADKPVADGIGSIGNDGGGLGILPRFDRDFVVGLIWSVYMLVVLMVLSFWLGERHEYHVLKANMRRSHRA